MFILCCIDDYLSFVQGRDKDCILVSFVKSTEIPRNNSSSLLGDWHRINVALTRAKVRILTIPISILLLCYVTGSCRLCAVVL